MRGALIWLDGGDPTATMDRLRTRDPVLASLTAVLHRWRAAFGFEPVTVRKAIEVAGDNPDLHDVLMAVAGRNGKIDSRALGNWLANHAADRVVNLADELKPEPFAMVRSGERQGVAQWKLTARPVG